MTKIEGEPARHSRVGTGGHGTGPTGHDSSNLRKHTSANPLQRALINRFHRLIGDQIEGLQPRTFLDAGCGEGFVAAMLRRRLPGLEISGFDLDPAAVRVATRRDPRGVFLAASIFSLPFADDTFDVIGCFEVLEHLPGNGPDRALAELNRVARRAVVLSVPHEPYFSLANAARGKNWDVRPRGSDPDHLQFWTRQSFGAAVARTLDVVWLGGSMPWTVCVAKPRDDGPAPVAGPEIA
ncbi:MAG: class I SAM-dependent methyltransferase [Chloroflexota bacterium]|nr:class I SAM-dependent methyltransferase [Chloroflexota bacterium]